MSNQPNSEPEVSGPESEQLSDVASHLVKKVRESFSEGGDLAASERQRMAILGRVLSVGDDESSFNSLDSSPSNQLEADASKSGR